MKADTFYTDHAIDDLVLTSDEAFELFRRNFKWNLSNCTVSEDGKLMTYDLRTTRLADQIEQEAEKIIELLHLPLEAAIETWTRGPYPAGQVVYLRVRFINS